MFGVMGIWSRGLFSWFCIRFYATVEILEITGLSKTSEIFNVGSLYYLGFSGKSSWSFGDVISELWNFEENCPVLDTNLVIMY